MIKGKVVVEVKIQKLYVCCRGWNLRSLPYLCLFSSICPVTPETKDAQRKGSAPSAAANLP